MTPTQPVSCPCFPEYLRYSPQSLRLGALIIDTSRTLSRGYPLLSTQPVSCPYSPQYIRCSPQFLRLAALITDTSCPTLPQMLTSVPQTSSSHHIYQLPPLSSLSSAAYSAYQLSLLLTVPQMLTSVPQTRSSHHRYKLSHTTWMLTSVPHSRSSHHRYQLPPL